MPRECDVRVRITECGVLRVQRCNLFETPGERVRDQVLVDALDEIEVLWLG
jgi:hypothetical protein